MSRELSVWNNMRNGIDSGTMIWEEGSEKQSILRNMMNSIDPRTQMTPLMRAAEMGAFEMARILVLNGADVDLYNNKG